MTDPRELQASDIVSIDAEPLSGVQFRVSDTQVKDIGITEVIAVTLVSDSEDGSNYSLTGTTSDSVFALNELGDGAVSSEGSKRGTSDGEASDRGDDEVRVTENAICLVTE